MPGRLGLVPMLASILLLAACAQGASQASIEGNWLVEDIGGRGVIDRARTTIAFGDEGSVSGSGGCNQFNGSAEVAAEALSFGPLASTRRACAEALMDQEDRFFVALEAVRSYRFDGPLLLLADETGEPLIRLTRLE